MSEVEVWVSSWAAVGLIAAVGLLVGVVVGAAARGRSMKRLRASVDALTYQVATLSTGFTASSGGHGGHDVTAPDVEDGSVSPAEGPGTSDDDRVDEDLVDLAELDAARSSADLWDSTARDSDRSADTPVVDDHLDDDLHASGPSGEGTWLDEAPAATGAAFGPDHLEGGASDGDRDGAAAPKHLAPTDARSSWDEGHWGADSWAGDLDRSPERSAGSVEGTDDGDLNGDGDLSVGVDVFAGTAGVVGSTEGDWGDELSYWDDSAGPDVVPDGPVAPPGPFEVGEGPAAPAAAAVHPMAAAADVAGAEVAQVPVPDQPEADETAAAPSPAAEVVRSAEDDLAQLTGMRPAATPGTWEPFVADAELLAGWALASDPQWWDPVSATSIADGPVATFDISSGNETVTACAVKLRGRAWQMAIRPTDPERRVDSYLGFVDLSFGDEAFDLAFQVTCTNREAALVALTEPFRRLLMGLAGAWAVELVEDTLVMVRTEPYLRRRFRSVWTARTAQLAAGSAFTALSVAEHLPAAALDRPHPLDLP